MGKFKKTFYHKSNIYKNIQALSACIGTIKLIGVNEILGFQIKDKLTSFTVLPSLLS